MSLTKGTPASSQIIWLEGRVKEPEQQRDELVEALQLISNGSTPAKFIAGLALAKVKK